MPKTTLILARHGECVSNFDNVFIGRSVDPELTEKGIKQAQSLAKNLKTERAAAIYSSPLLRARQTAQIIAGEQNLTVLHSKELIEVGLGALDGRDISNPGFLSIYENMVSNWENGYPQVCVPEGESLLDVKVRLEKFLSTNILNKKWNSPIIIVGHAILWMAFIWLFCKNHSPRINDGFLDKAHFSIISNNGIGFVLDRNNLNNNDKIFMKSLH